MRSTLLLEASMHRSTADMLERSAAQNDTLADSACEFALADEELHALLSDSQQMRTQAAQHRAAASHSEWNAGLEYRPTLQPRQLQQPPEDLRPILTTAAAAAATILPGGWVIGAAAVTAAPYLGIDPDGSATRFVRATLHRDARGLFNFLLKEDEQGVYLAALLEGGGTLEGGGNAGGGEGLVGDEPLESGGGGGGGGGDERIALRVGDRIRSLDGALVRAEGMARASSAAVANGTGSQAEDDGGGGAASGAAAAAGSQAGTSTQAGSSTQAWLGYEEAKQRVRAAGASLMVEVYRREIRPATERLLESKASGVESPMLHASSVIRT